MRIDYGIFFTIEGTVFRLPHNPEKLPVTKDNENGEYNVLGIGPITIPRIPKQQEVTISGYFPGRVDGYTVTPNGFQEPEFYIQQFQRAMDEKLVITYTPVRYYEDGTPFFTSDEGFQCIVTGFTYEERGGETGDFYYDLTIREWRDYSPQAVTAKQETSPTTGEATTVLTQEPSRDIPQGQLTVGATVIANGNYYYTSYGDEPHGTANGSRVVISRIVTDDATRQCKIHITTESGGALGWIAADQLQVVSE